MPSRTSKFLQGVAVTTFTSIGAFIVWTKHCKFEDMDLSADPIFRSKWLAKFNPLGNPTVNDMCVRRQPLFKIRPDLLEDAQNGGSKLVEAFVAGVYGNFNYMPQRKILELKHRSKPETADHLWDVQQIRSSTFEPGTIITDHFVVLDKTKNSILVRCGDSPRSSPDGPREVDGLFEMSAVANIDKGFAEFKMKCVFYQGDQKVNTSPMNAQLQWLHMMYTKFWMEGAMSNVKA